VDWVTPFSLLYLYKHIGASKTNKDTKYRNDQDNSVGIERIKMLLELQDENEEAGSQQNTLNSSS
jgi:Mg2+/Co2+ transporter CorB